MAIYGNTKMRYTIFIRISHKEGAMTVKERDFMGGLAKRLKVIEAFSAERPKLSISEAADIVMLDRATTRRCLLTLAHLGYCTYDGKFFTVTPRILRLGTACLATMPLPRIVQPVLDQLSEKIRQSTSVSVLDETDIVYIARASWRRVMSIALMPGSRLPAYCTSMGRVLLASLAEGKKRAILQRTVRIERTSYTMTDMEMLMGELDSIRLQGYALIDQEVEAGLRSIAVPLVNRRGQTVAALNVGLPVAAEPIQVLVEMYLPHLLSVQKELKEYLG